MKLKAVALLALTSSITTALAQEVSIPDPALKFRIWGALDKPEPVGTLTVEDMLSLTNLSILPPGGRLGDSFVQSLEGLEAARNLTTLELVSPPLTNFSSLARLTTLTTLHVSRTSLGDGSVLSGLKNLTTLGLSGDEPLTDFSPLSRLTNLTKLQLSESGLTNVSLKT